jgi:hypothetical protein
MKQSKITIIQDYLKQYQPTLININKVIKKKNNFIVNCTIDPTLSKITQDDIFESIPSNITEQKTYIIPQKDIQFPTKRKIPKVKKIYLS